MRYAVASLASLTELLRYKRMQENKIHANRLWFVALKQTFLSSQSSVSICARYVILVCTIYPERFGYNDIFTG